jgi:Kef-type K+ transport system membrane component KefB
MDFTLSNLFLVTLVAFSIPFVLGLYPKVGLPSAVVELIAGMVLGPAVLGWIEPDLPVQVMSAVGVAFLLFLAGAELDLRVLRYTMAGGAVAEFGTIVLLGLFFAKPGSVLVGEAGLLLVIAVLAVLLLWGLARFSRWETTRQVFLRLDDSSAQVRVRLAVLILLAAAVVASTFGFEAILGTFIAGAVFAIVVRRWDDVETYRKKLNGLGFGFFVPVFFVYSGMRLEPGELLGWFEIVRTLVLFLVLVIVRALPALLYRRHLSRREMAAAGLLQATNLSFIVVAVTVGEELGAITVSGGEGLIAAGLLSAIILPPIAQRLLRSSPRRTEPGEAAAPAQDVSASARTPA